MKVFPVDSNGGSTGLAPIHVRIIKILTNDQNFSLDDGLNFLVFAFISGRVAKTAIEAIRATTPPSFDGIDRRIAYANRKYHSGWICTGVDRGLAMFRFSTSPKKFGLFEIIIIIETEIQIRGVRSLIVNDGWNFTLSNWVFVPVGLDDPLTCRAIRWMMIIAEIIIGTKKCNEKNRFRVGCETEKFPHIHSTSLLPTMGMAEKMFVITVAPQNDICPHGRTYPRKAVAITKTIRRSPESHTIGLLYGEAK